MEHRYSPRISANLKVLIYKRGQPMAIGWLRNVSRHGLFVASDSGNVALNQMLEIEVLGDCPDGDSHRRCRAMVTHKTVEGFGLAIDDDCPMSSEVVSELVVKYRRPNMAFQTSAKIAEVAAESVFSL